MFNVRLSLDQRNLDYPQRSVTGEHLLAGRLDVHLRQKFSSSCHPAIPVVYPYVDLSIT